jgi:hypothetical protein
MALNWHSCWPVLRDPEELLIFGFMFIWFAAFFLIRPVLRALFVAITLIVIFLPGHEQYPHAESSCVGALREMHASIEAIRANNARQEYPGTFTFSNVPPSARKVFKFEYIPLRLEDGRVEGYTIQATPICRDSGPPRSFSIVEDGTVHYTHEPRAATRSDFRLE